MIDIRNSLDFDIRSSINLENQSQSPMKFQKTEVPLGKNKFVLHKGLLHLSDGNGILVNLKHFTTLSIDSLDQKLLAWFELDQNAADFEQKIMAGNYLVPSGINVIFEGGKYISDGKGFFMSKTGLANFTGAKILEMNKVAQRAYQVQLASKIEEFNEEVKNRIENSEILPIGAEICYNKCQLVSNGFGLFEDVTSKTLVHIHPVICKWLHFSNQKSNKRSTLLAEIAVKGTHYEFQGS